jgi:hypothetical protein
MRARIRLSWMLLAAPVVLPVSAAEHEPKWGPHIDFEAKPGSKRTLGEADLFVPLWQDERRLLFGNARARLDDGGSHEWNIGLGVRRMSDGGWNFGGYGYLDRRRSGLGNDYHQVALGGEALGRDWDFRGNLYRPIGTRTHSIDAGISAAVVGTTVAITTLRRDERALKGYDAEAGWRVPLFGVDDQRQLRVYAGGYRFKDEVANVSGPRLRAELTVSELTHWWPGAQLEAGAEVQEDDLRGRQGFLSLRVRVPLGTGNAPARKLTLQARRMTVPVKRDVDIVAPVVAHATVETTNTLANGQPFQVLNSQTTSGAQFPAAVAAAGANSTVILVGTFNPIDETFLQPGQTVAGSTTFTVRTASGRAFTLTTPRASVAVAFANRPAFNVATNSTLTGLNIRSINNVGGASAEGIWTIEGSSGATIAHNTIFVRGNLATGIKADWSTNLRVHGNAITADLAITLDPNLGPVSVQLSNNTLATHAGGSSTHTYIEHTIGFPLEILPGSTGNVVVSGICFIVGGHPITGAITYTNAPSCP